MKKTKQLQTLNANFENTNWNNARYEGGKLVADYYGTIYDSIGNGQTNVYEGTTTCCISPSHKLFETVFDCGFDQNGFINQEMDYSVL